MNSREWYESLAKPSWAPDPIVFGRVWAVLYIIIFWVNLRLFAMFSSGEIDAKTIAPFWINIFLNIIFSPIQFGIKNNGLSSLLIISILVTIIWSIAAIWPHDKTLALAYIPYLIWVAIATLLQVQIWLLNR